MYHVNGACVVGNELDLYRFNVDFVSLMYSESTFVVSRGTSDEN